MLQQIDTVNLLMSEPSGVSYCSYMKNVHICICEIKNLIKMLRW